MQLNPCLVCQDRKTSSISVWALHLWSTASNPRWHFPSHQEKKKKRSSCQTLSFPLAIFQAHDRLKACQRRSAPNRMSGWNGCWVPVKDAFQQTWGISSSSMWNCPWEAKQSEKIRGRRRYDEWGRDHSGPVRERSLGFGSQRILCDLQQAWV